MTAVTEATIKRLRRLQMLQSKIDPYFWLTEMCYTFDEHDDDNPYKLFPKKPHIKNFAETWEKEDLIIVEKSRQQMFSWLCCGLILRDTLFKEARHWFVVSKKEKDADKMLTRIDHLYNMLPEEFKQSGYRRVENIIRFPENRGIIEAVSQNADALRSNVSSGVFIDEAEFLEQFKLTFESVKPTLDGGGKLICVSTVNGKGPVWRLMNDKLNDHVNAA